MAFLYQLPGNPPLALFNVEQAVGANGANANGDVKLVQYFLKHLCGQTDQQMPVDGYIGHKTASLLRKYQEALKSAGNDVLVDGRVDRCFDAMSKVSRTSYTILLMNQQLRKYYPAEYDRLPQVVPINPHPRANPYNPVNETLDASRRSGGRIIGVFPGPTHWTIMYSDRTVRLIPNNDTNRMIVGILPTEKGVKVIYHDGWTKELVVAGEIWIDGKRVSPA